MVRNKSCIESSVIDAKAKSPNGIFASSTVAAAGELIGWIHPLSDISVKFFATLKALLWTFHIKDLKLVICPFPE